MGSEKTPPYESSDDTGGNGGTPAQADKRLDAPHASDPPPDAGRRRNAILSEPQEPRPSSGLAYDSFEQDDRHPSHDSSFPQNRERPTAARTSIGQEDDAARDWSRLRRRHRGMGEQDRAEQLRQHGIQRDIDIIADRLGATDHHRDRTEWLLDRISVKDDLLPSGPIEVAVLGTISVVIDEDRGRYRGHGVQSVLRDDEFDRLCTEFDVDRGQVRDVRRRLRETEVYQRTRD